MHGSRDYGDLQNWLDMMSHEKPLYLEWWMLASTTIKILIAHPL